MTSALLKTVNYKGVHWSDVDWDKPIHRMDRCNCCGGDEMGHTNGCLYLFSNHTQASARPWLERQIKEALQREGRPI